MASSESFDLAVIGAGPAGLAAATAAADAGLRVALIDAGGQPGGQFWRHADESVRDDDGAHHHDWPTFLSLRDRLRTHIDASRVAYLPRQQVWMAERRGESEGRAGRRARPKVVERQASYRLHLTPSHLGVDDGRRQLDAGALVLCPGGYDRQLPIPGWTTPGVMSAGAAQALLKGSGTLAGRRAIVAGTGPFLLPVAAGLASAGATVVGVCEANSPMRWLRQSADAARVPGKALEAVAYAAVFAKHRVPYRTRTVVTRIHGDDEVRGARLARVTPDGRLVAGSEREVDVDLVALGWGFTPSLELVLSLGARTRRDVDGSLVAVVDDFQRSSIPSAYVAGEATGIGGAAKAVAEGELAGIAAAGDAGRPVNGQRITRLRATLRRARAFARAMHRAHPVPAGWTDWLDDGTTLCRCEEIPVGTVRSAYDGLGAGDPRGVKSMARPGMGWCQGRICGFATAELIAAHEGRTTTADELRPLSTRPCAVPVTLGELAALDTTTKQ